MPRSGRGVLSLKNSYLYVIIFQSHFMTSSEFKNQIAEGIPAELPELKSYDQNINHAPKRKDILDNTEKRLAIKNALRYFPVKFHQLLAKEFAGELLAYGRIYMYRFRPDY